MKRWRRMMIAPIPGTQCYDAEAAEVFDRHGKSRWYFRKPGFPRVPLPGLPWTPAFMAAYEQALAASPVQIGRSKVPTGSLSALIALYYQSHDFTQLRASTQATYRGILERLRADYGELPVARMERKHIAAIISKRASTPAAANNLLRLFQLIMRTALENDWVTIDPTIGVRKIRHKTEGFRTWSQADISAFEEAFHVGTRERLALGILLFTASRRSDAVHLGPQDVKDGRIRFRQQKTGNEVASRFIQT
jgi:hypothetical protein